MEKIDLKLRNLLSSVCYGLSQTDIKNSLELIEHNEFGIAFELICEQLNERDVVVSNDVIKSIEDIAAIMQLSDETWIFLKNI